MITSGSLHAESRATATKPATPMPAAPVIRFRERPIIYKTSAKLGNTLEPKSVLSENVGLVLVSSLVLYCELFSMWPDAAKR